MMDPSSESGEIAGRLPRPALTWLIACLLIAAALMAHLRVLENDFVPYDDPQYVLDVPEMGSGFRWRNIAWAFSTRDGSNYFPITRISWMLDAELFGIKPAGFHASSLALHTVNAVLLFFALFRLTRQLWPSAIVAAIFAVHPLHVESVAWVSARKDLTSGFFFLLTLLAHERRVRGQRPRAWGAACAVSLGLGLMSKPVLVTLPFVLLLLDVWPLRRWERGTVLTLFREKAVLFALALCSVVVTVSAQQQALAPVELFPVPTRFLSTALAYLEYVERAFWPDNLAVLYPLSRHAGTRLGVAIAGLFIVSILAVGRVRSRPWYFVGWFWFAGMLVPSSSLLQVGEQASADRYTYLPLVGLSILLVWGARDLLAQLPPTLGRAGVGGLDYLNQAKVSVNSARAALGMRKLWRVVGKVPARTSAA